MKVDELTFNLNKSIKKVKLKKIRVNFHLIIIESILFIAINILPTLNEILLFLIVLNFLGKNFYSSLF